MAYVVMSLPDEYLYQPINFNYYTDAVSFQKILERNLFLAAFSAHAVGERRGLGRIEGRRRKDLGETHL